MLLHTQNNFKILLITQRVESTNVKDYLLPLAGLNLMIYGRTIFRRQHTVA